MNVHLINPSHVSFGTAVITPRWLYVLAGATPKTYGDPILVDETLALLDPAYHPATATSSASGSIPATRCAATKSDAMLAPVEPTSFTAAFTPRFIPKKRWNSAALMLWSRAMATWSGRLCWPTVSSGSPKTIYEGGRIDADQFSAARWDLIPRKSYMWASVQTVRGCPKHCSFCSVWRTDGQKPRQRPADAVVEEIVQLRRQGFRFIALADDNFYPVTLTDLELAGTPEEQSASGATEEPSARSALN